MRVGTKNLQQQNRTAAPEFIGRLAWFALFSLFGGIEIPAAHSAAQTQSESLSANTALQISQLIADKAARTAAQRKIDAKLLLATKSNYELPGLPALRPMRMPQGGLVAVNITARVTSRLRAGIAAAGGFIVSAHPNYNTIFAQVPASQAEAIAALPDVRTISLTTSASANATPHKVDSSRTLPPGINSEADAVHGADRARRDFKINGAGVKIGVIADSVDGLAAAQARGELPAVQVLPGRSGVPASGEGTALLLLIHAIAPGAELFFSSSGTGAASMAQNILDLRAAGCDIIVDDLLLHSESPFQGSAIDDAINAVTASGALYFTAVGNEGNYGSAASGTWEGDFAPGDALRQRGKTLGIAHRFSDGATKCDFNTFRGKDEQFVALYWSDPQGAARSDYDLYVLDAAGNVVAVSNNDQTGTQDPYEITRVRPGERLVVLKASGQPRFLHLQTDDGALQYGTPGAVRGHAGNPNAISVAATSTERSFPDAFSGGTFNRVENYSSDGPRRIFYGAGGKALTTSLLGDGGFVVSKPDITAATGTGLSRLDATYFYGTSAAVANAAGIAALIKSFRPGLTALQTRAVLTATALDIETPGYDTISGAGIVMAYAALQALSQMP